MKKRFFQKMFAFVFALTMLGSILCGAAVIPLDKETEAPAPFALSDVCSVTYRNGAVSKSPSPTDRCLNSLLP